MRRLYTLQLVPGMVVAENVSSFSRQLIIPKGTVLTDKLITKLDLYGILTVNVEDAVPQSEPVLTEPQISSLSERIRQSPEFQHFKRDYKLNVDCFENMINEMVEKNIKLDAQTLLHRSLDMIADGGGQVGVLDMLHNMREYDDSTFAHCMNVGLICNVMTTWLKFDKSQVELATACGLFHDIGKLLVPHNILAKPGKLSSDEYAEIQKHPVAGYQLLLSQDVDNHVRYAALMHHERCDGSGYPMHLMGDKIDMYARIVAIADVYEAITAARVYRGPLCPFRAIEIFETDGFQKYDTKFLLTFLENVVNTYLQNRCRLSDNREGTIIYINKEKLSRPVVQCEDEYIDLMEYPELSITDIL